LSTVQVLDPEARAFADCEASAERLTIGLGDADPEARNLAVVARRDGRIVGTVEGWARAGVALVLELCVAREVHGEGVEGHLLASFESAALSQDCRRLGARLWSGSLAETACRDRGWVEECRLRSWYGERDLVHLRRDL
ncbi:MAG: GNAT family N-acetyltransferase, partial [Actinobacteria bacterium]|nr:GNAT family N-acetyltransferase [Actinomycetota bacterium]